MRLTKIYEKLENKKYLTEFDDREKAIIDDIVNNIAKEFSVSKEDIQTKINKQNTNMSTLMLIIQIKNLDRIHVLNIIQDVIKPSKHYEIERQEHSISTKGIVSIRQLNPKAIGYRNIKIAVKDSTKPVNVHEELTATILNSKNKKIIDYVGKSDISNEEITDLVITLKDEATNSSMVGIDYNKIKKFDDNTEDLGPAFSAAEAILNYENGAFSDVEKIWLSGSKFPSDKELQKFNLQEGMRTYNSADLILRAKKGYLGVSLKKKPRIESPDPTLINKSMEDFFNAFVNSEEIDELIESKINFYARLLFENKIVHEKLTTWNAITPFLKSLKNKTVNEALKKSNNEYFAKIEDIIMSRNNEFLEKFLRLAFRVELDDLKKYDYDYITVSGIGRKLANGLKVEKAKTTPVEIARKKIDEMFEDGGDKVGLKISDRTKLDNEDTRSSAVLYYDVLYENKEIIEIELRYKGIFHGSPSFLTRVKYRDFMGDKV